MKAALTPFVRATALQAVLHAEDCAAPSGVSFAASFLSNVYVLTYMQSTYMYIAY